MEIVVAMRDRCVTGIEIIIFFHDLNVEKSILFGIRGVEIIIL